MSHQSSSTSAQCQEKSDFGRWSVLDRSGEKWLCQCVCGTFKRVYKYDLIKGKSTGCRCKNRDLITSLNKKRATHGSTSTPEFRAWTAMKSRCSDSNAPSWANYGGRGISVCDRWKASFEDFFADMGSRPSPKHSIDRIDVNGNYCPENCRWATPKEQACNKRTNVNLTWQGETRTLYDWSKITGIGRHVIRSRLKKGWSLDLALTEPTQKRRSRK